MVECNWFHDTVFIEEAPRTLVQVRGEFDERGSQATEVVDLLAQR